MTNPYADLKTDEAKQKKTEQLIAEHPLGKHLPKLAENAWNALWSNSYIDGVPLKELDGLSGQLTGWLIEAVFVRHVVKFSSDYRKQEKKSEKDIVCKSEVFFCFLANLFAHASVGEVFD